MMNNISALRHNAENPASSDSDEEEISPWPEHEHEHLLSYSSFAPSEQSQWANYEWSNRNGKSIPKELPKDQHYPINLFGRTAAEAFADFPEPPEDFSSGDDDFAAHFPDTRPPRPPRQRSPSSQSLYAISNERHTQKVPQLPPTEILRLPVQNYGFPDGLYAAEDPSTFPFSSQFDDSNKPRIANEYLDVDENRRRRGKQLFDETERDPARRYFATPVLSSPLSVDSPGDMSAKAKGKQRSFEDEGTIPDAQMSGLRLGIDQLLPLQLGDEWRRSHSRNSTTESVYLEDNDVSTGRRSKNATSHSSRTSRSRNTPSRFGKRSVISEDEEDESAMDHALPDSDTKPSGKKRKVNRYPCPVPLCKETFTRRNDVRRHIKNAAVHRDSPEALALLGEAVVTGTRCKYCNADLSRADARMRHERASACGKRTTQKMKDQMLLMKA